MLKLFEIEEANNGWLLTIYDPEEYAPYRYVYSDVNELMSALIKLFGCKPKEILTAI